MRGWGAADDRQSGLGSASSATGETCAAIQGAPLLVQPVELRGSQREHARLSTDFRSFMAYSGTQTPQDSGLGADCLFVAADAGS